MSNKFGIIFATQMFVSFIVPRTFSSVISFIVKRLDHLNISSHKYIIDITSAFE